MKEIVDHDLGFVVDGKVIKRNSKVSQGEFTVSSQSSYKTLHSIFFSFIFWLKYPAMFFNFT